MSELNSLNIPDAASLFASGKSLKEGDVREQFFVPVTNALESLDGRAVGKSDVLLDWTKKLITGEALGTEGRWKFEFAGSITPSTAFTATYTTVTTILRSYGVTFPQTWGTRDRIEPEFFGVIFGDSGTPYKSHCVANVYGSNDDVYIHPKHGDVRSDFTVGNTYPVYVFQEATDPADQQTGDLDVKEYFLGSGRTSVADMNAITGGIGNFCTLNAGYWDGPNWKSQLLGDTTPRGGQLELKQSRKDAGGAFTVEVLNATGGWQLYTSGDWAAGQYKTARDPVKNTVLVNVTQSFAALGYSSEADMLANSAVRVEYKTKARRLRPYDLPLNPLVIGDIRDMYGVEIAQLVSEFIGDVTTNASTLSSVFPVTSIAMREANHYIRFAYYDPALAVPSRGVVTLPLLIQLGGTLHIAFPFTEIVPDVDSGATGKAVDALANYVVTTTDDNGNTVLCGCMGYDTGIAV